MRILLDENLPRKLVAALASLGHDVESVHTLRMQGLDNGRLYQFARVNFELCFTRDAGFVHKRATKPNFARLQAFARNARAETTGRLYIRLSRGIHENRLERIAAR